MARGRGIGWLCALVFGVVWVCCSVSSGLLLLVILFIVDKLTGWEAQRISKVVNKAALFCGEKTVTVHVALFMCEPKGVY